MPLSDFRSIYLPYCIEKQDDGSWVVLNREYKPVGFNTRKHIAYNEYPVCTKFKGLSPAKLKKLSYKGEVSNRIYLYNDGSVPTHSTENMKCYLERIGILAKLEVDDS